MILEIPTTGGAEYARYVQRTVLDGKEYLFRFLWNDRASCWICNVYTGEEQLIGVCKLKLGRELLGSVVKSKRWPGKLRVVSLSNSGEDPTLDSLGVDHVLVYSDSSEFSNNDLVLAVNVTPS